jgi:hypothetical protein
VKRHPAEEGLEDPSELHRPELEVHLPNPKGMELQMMRNRVCHAARAGVFDPELRRLDKLREDRKR